MLCSQKYVMHASTVRGCLINCTEKGNFYSNNEKKKKVKI